MKIHRNIPSICMLIDMRMANSADFLINDLENLRTSFFDQWHWRMINDATRNEAFNRGIELVLKEVEKTHDSNMTIMDLGCGTGLLTVMLGNNISLCSKISEPQCIYALDSNYTCSVVTQKVIEKNGISAQVFNMKSTDFESMPTGRYLDLIISETLDCAIFGEHFCSSLLDLHDRFEGPVPFRVVPKRASLYAQAIYSPELAKDYSKNLKNGILMSNPVVYMQNNTYAVTYDCTYMDKIDYQALSQPVNAISIDFETVEELRKVVDNEVRKSVKFNVKAGLRPTAIMAWFECETYPGVEFSTKPGNSSCWPQAVFTLIFRDDPLAEDTELNFMFYIENEQCFFISQETIGFDCVQKGEFEFKLLNCEKLINFFQEFIDKSTDVVLNYTGLILEPKEVKEKRSKLGKEEGAGKIRNCLEKVHIEAELSEASTIAVFPFDSRGTFTPDGTIFCQASSMFNKQIFPCAMRIHAQMFRSDELMNCAKLVPKEKRGRVYCNVDLDTIESMHIRYFEEVDINKMDITILSDEVEAIKVGLKFEKLQNSTSTTTLITAGPADGILYWHELEGPSGQKFSFKRDYGIVKAFIFAERHGVEGQNVVLNTTFQNGQFTFAVPTFDEPSESRFYATFSGTVL
ncbi:unnamed protein product [Bursaphelenchus okinawaensis]|uniref:Protein arginine N-methyltransferase n=1 Tax=Bursaphelenchus okinawaensis TaxID=465554 RepID=A0A811KSA5_9BILA|nr:unnamed protein product [Bursaphelenchus okinawaensis]CAG9109460.1 unnamed protein product [Bursaphelenchus okinawaensis]